MQLDRKKIIESAFIPFIEQLKTSDSQGTFFREKSKVLKAMFFAQLRSRALDYHGRNLKKKDLGYYTISSAGHESNVILAELLKVTDPCFLHYRSGAFMAHRYRFDSDRDYTEDVLMSLMCSKDEPISGGRHKVWGSVKLNVLPQTSTIASHLPKAVGAAFALAKLKNQTVLENINKDSIVCCSFGDASANHSTALGAVNTAKWTAYQNLPMPIVFVCEDNGLGISVRTPQNWIKHNFSGAKDLKYFYADGNNIENAYQQSKAAVDFCREFKKPVFLHLKTTRLMGHAGSDIQAAYLSEAEIVQQEKNDPLLAWSKILVEQGVLNKREIIDSYEAMVSDLRQKSARYLATPKLQSYQDVMCVYNNEQKIINTKRLSSNQPALSEIEIEDPQKPRHMAASISLALKELMTKDRSVVVFGEDVAKKGGVYHVTKGLYEYFGPARVFNTLLDEQSILGLAIGMSHMGFLPIPEIQYLAYYHNAQDQIRSEAVSAAFFSNAQFHNPMVIRIASFAYQKGFGGHFHNDNSIAVLRDLPGAIVVSPSRSDDAVKLLRESYRLAKDCGKVVFFLEPIARYMSKDLFENKDSAWSFPYPKQSESIAFGQCQVYGKSKTVILTYANGVYMSLRAAKLFKEQTDQDISVIDLRWLHPLPMQSLFINLVALNADKVLIVDECRKNGGIVENLGLEIAQEFKDIDLKIIQAKDSYIPLGPAAETILPTEDDIIKELKTLTKQ